MGNQNAVHCSSNHRNMDNMRKRTAVDETTMIKKAHEGIETVATNSSCGFSNNSDLSICLVTWNMNGRVTYEDIVKLVESKYRFDLLVVALQEAPRTKTSKMLKSAMAETHILLGKAVMKSVQLYVFGPKSSAILTQEVKVDTYSLGGLGGLIRRQKGAVAIRINFKGIRMLFISCHLSAHEHNVEERNSECKDISDSLFSKEDWNSQPAQLTVFLGDFNYRLRGIASQPARNLIQNDLQKLLIGKDQLLQEAERGEIFNGFCEGKLSFKPTYKYDIGSSHYDTSHKVRVPAWTDRILFKLEDSGKVHVSLHSYESVDNIESSDHKPVKAHLSLRGELKSRSITSKDKRECGVRRPSLDNTTSFWAVWQSNLHIHWLPAGHGTILLFQLSAL